MTAHWLAALESIDSTYVCITFSHSIYEGKWSEDGADSTPAQ
jgi:hypothetical protein